MHQKQYGVLKSKITIDKGEYTSRKTHLSHYNLITVENNLSYQVNIDIQSDQYSPNVKMLCIPKYQHDIIKHFSNLKNGFTPLKSEKGGLALDYLREDLFPQKDLFQSKPLSVQEITNTLHHYLEVHEEVVVFGMCYGSEDLKDIQLGLDDVHLNQGSIGKHANANGIYQDGALFIHRPDKTYTAFFFSFSEQCAHTNENGNCL